MGNRERKAEYRKWSIKCRKLKRKTENGKQKTRMKSYQTSTKLVSKQKTKNRKWKPEKNKKNGNQKTKKQSFKKFKVLHQSKIFKK